MLLHGRLLLLNTQKTIKSYYWYHTDKCFDVVIVGGGIVGVAAARQMKLLKPNLSLCILEKENAVAQHQSGHNSGVIHAGIYYKPNSIRAQLCTEGLKLSYQYLNEKNLPYEKVGKLIVANNLDEVARLDDLFQRGLQNNVKDIKIVTADKIKEYEPHCKGVKAIHSPHTGITDWALVTKQMAKDILEMNGKIKLNFEVSNFKMDKDIKDVDNNRYPVTIESTKYDSINASFVLCCTGLYSDKVAQLSGGNKEPSIIPFRGEYLLLKPEKRHLVKGNIYPVPDPRFPFLGVHFTPRLDGSIWVGPNAVLAFKREGYKYTDISMKNLYECLKHKGFQRLVRKYLSFGINEMAKSIFIERQVVELQKYIPLITKNDLIPGPSGVRAQAIDLKGELIEDFVFDSIGKNARILHCRNAPSPAATSSLAIAKVLTVKLFSLMDNY